MTHSRQHPNPGSLSPQVVYRRGGIKQQVLSKPHAKALGRQTNGAMIASGTAISNPGRIAGGAPGVANPQFHSVFAPIVYRNPLGATPGGLIDRRQQIDPASTQFAHPFSGGRYRSTASHILLPRLTNWNGFVVHDAETPLLQPHERGTFFRRGHTPAIKMQFGANQSGTPADTAFHRQPQIKLPHPVVKSVTPTEKLSPVYKPPSFLSFNRLVSNATNTSAASSQYGAGGRWAQLKRGANEG
jgi:hypothetical protein